MQDHMIFTFKILISHNHSSAISEYTLKKKKEFLFLFTIWVGMVFRMFISLCVSLYFKWFVLGIGTVKQPTVALLYIRLGSSVPITPLKRQRFIVSLSHILVCIMPHILCFICTLKKTNRTPMDLHTATRSLNGIAWHHFLRTCSSKSCSSMPIKSKLEQARVNFWNCS